MRRREKKVRPDDRQADPAIEQLVVFRWREWVSDDEQATAPATELGWELLDVLAFRRWMEAQSGWAERQGFKRGEVYPRLDALRRQVYPPIHDAVVSTQERSQGAMEGQG